MCHLIYLMIATSARNSSELFGDWILILFVQPNRASLCQEINLAGCVPPKQILQSSQLLSKTQHSGLDIQFRQN